MEKENRDVEIACLEARDSAGNRELAQGRWDGERGKEGGAGVFQVQLRKKTTTSVQYNTSRRQKNDLGRKKKKEQ